MIPSVWLATVILSAIFVVLQVVSPMIVPIILLLGIFHLILVTLDP